MAFNMSAIMDAISETLIADVTKRVYPWPTDSITIPCMVVGYPTELDFDYTFSRGSDRAIFPVYYMAGKVTDRNTRDELSRAIDGTSGIKDAIDGTLNGTVSMARVTDVSVTSIQINGIDYTALQCNVEIIS